MAWGQVRDKYVGPLTKTTCDETMLSTPENVLIIYIFMQ